MAKTTKTSAFLGGVALAAFAAGSALADGMSGVSLKDAPKDEGRKLTWSWNIGATSDYVFRGFSQSAQSPAIQAGADLSYGILYAGFWGSGIDFGTYNAPGPDTRQVGGFAEIDWYAGIKPTLGPVNFDLGVIYYSYPGAKDGNPLVDGKPREWDYFEVKVGYSTSAFIKSLTTGTTVFFSPDYTNRQGATWTIESTAAYELPKLGFLTPTISGTWGVQYGDYDRTKDAAGLATYVQANGKDSYSYWNAGIAFAIDKLTLDFRYWDTDVKNNNPARGAPSTNFCNGRVFQCDERFVGSAKLTF